MSVLVNSIGGTIPDFTGITPTYFRATRTITGLTAGHKYVVAISNLNVTGNERSVNGYDCPYDGFTDVEVAIRFGDGVGHNSNQRAEGGIIIGKATGTSATVGYTAYDKQAVMVVDLG